jgi:hypothetical protein
MTTYPVLEHGQSRLGRWFRARRLRLALLIGAAETLLILFTSATWRWALVLAAIVFAFYWFVGRKTRYDTIHQISWTLAASQTFPVLLPVVAVFVSTLVIIALVFLAIAMLGLLYLDRRA